MPLSHWPRNIVSASCHARALINCNPAQTGDGGVPAPLKRIKTISGNRVITTIVLSQIVAVESTSIDRPFPSLLRSLASNSMAESRYRTKYTPNHETGTLFRRSTYRFSAHWRHKCGGLQLADFRQFPGGAPANVAVAVARLGGQAKFAGQVGDDPFGQFLEEALLHYGVGTTFLHKHPSAHTTLAFVFLDADGDRSFSFYRDRTADVLFSAEQVSDQWFVDHPILHVCSNTLTNQDIASVTEYVLEQGDCGELPSQLRCQFAPRAVARCSRRSLALRKRRTFCELHQMFERRDRFSLER